MPSNTPVGKSNISENYYHTRATLYAIWATLDSTIVLKHMRVLNFQPPPMIGKITKLNRRRMNGEKWRTFAELMKTCHLPQFYLLFIDISVYGGYYGYIFGRRLCTLVVSRIFV